MLWYSMTMGISANLLADEYHFDYFPSSRDFLSFLFQACRGSHHRIMYFVYNVNFLVHTINNSK